MNRKIKLIWDFRGPAAQKIAEHHVIHLKEFTAIEKLLSHVIATETISELYTVAYMIVDEKDMVIIRDSLKPHRGELAQ